MDSSVNLCLSVNGAHLTYAATLVASVCRRTIRKVHARIYVRGEELPRSFSTDDLLVEFLRPIYEPLQHYPPQGGTCVPGHVHAATWDRLEIVDYALDWDRCWIFDTDQMVIGDIGHLYDIDFEGSWMIAITDRENAIMSRKWFGRAWPDDAEGADAKMPYFGALMNLQEMRKGGFTQRFREALSRWGLNEQLCTSYAVKGRITEMPAEGNYCLFGYVSLNDPERLAMECGMHQAKVIHWTMPAKPWNNARLWAAQLWIRELISWVDLHTEQVFREQDRQKPLALFLYSGELDVPNDDVLDQLINKGYEVKLHASYCSELPLADLSSGNDKYMNCTRELFVCFVSVLYHLNQILSLPYPKSGMMIVSNVKLNVVDISDSLPAVLFENLQEGILHISWVKVDELVPIRDMLWNYVTSVSK